MPQLEEMIKSLPTSEPIDDVQREEARRVVRTRLYRAIREERHGGRRSSEHWRDRRRLRVALPSGLVVAVAAAVAVVLFLVPSGGSHGGGVGGGIVPVPGLGTGQAQAKEILSRAADLVATTPASAAPSTGQFIYAEWIDGTTGNEVMRGHNIRLTNGQTEQDWEAPDGSGRQRETAGFFQLLTPADNAQWLAAGSPSLTGAAPGGGTMDGTYPKGAYFNNCGIKPNALVGLSTDPTRLLQQIIQRFQQGHFNAGSTLGQAACIIETSAYPPLRAAAYRMLAQLPGIQSLGTKIDTLGRSGAAVGVQIPSIGEESVVIFDQSTGIPLETEDIQTSNDSKIYFTPPPKTEEQRERDVTLEQQQSLPNGTIVDYRVFVKSGVVNADEDLPGGGSIPFQGGTTHASSITCANLTSDTTPISCATPSAGAVPTSGVSCSLTAPGVVAGRYWPGSAVCPDGATTNTGTDATTNASTDATTDTSTDTTTSTPTGSTTTTGTTTG